MFDPQGLAAPAAKSLQSCLTPCDPIDGSPPGSAVPGILQARTLEWVAIAFSNAWKWKVKGKSLSHVWLFGTPRAAAHQAPPSMGFSRQEYWSGLPLPSPPWSRSYSFMITSTHPQQYLRIAIGLDTMILSLVIKDKYMNIHARIQIQLSQKW